MDKINASKLGPGVFKNLIMGDDLLWKTEEYLGTPYIPYTRRDLLREGNKLYPRVQYKPMDLETKSKLMQDITLGKSHERLLPAQQMLKNLPKWTGPIDPKTFAIEFRGQILGPTGKPITLENIERASPQQLELWKQQVINKYRKEFIDAIRQQEQAPKFIPKRSNLKLNREGGIIMELTDDEIQQYANGGFVVEELDYKPDAGKPINKKTTTSNVGYTPKTISTPKVSATPKINLNTEGLSYKPTASVKTQNVNPKPTVSPKPQETAKPKPVPEITIDSMSTILNKYDIGNSSPVMTVDSFQTIINKQEQERIAKAEKLRKQIEVSQKKIERESTPSYKYPEVFVEGMPNIRTTQSESFIQGRPLKNEVKKIVLHHTGSTDEKNNSKYVHNHFMNPESETSAHIVIEEDGQRTIYASPDQVTFHAGKSSWDGRSNVNDFGIGVEFQGDTNVKPLTSAQIKSFVEYFDQLAKKYNVSTEDIITHAMIAPGRKPDITDSQYRRILKYLKSRGYK